MTSVRWIGTQRAAHATQSGSARSTELSEDSGRGLVLPVTRGLAADPPLRPWPDCETPPADTFAAIVDEQARAVGMRMVVAADGPLPVWSLDTQPGNRGALRAFPLPTGSVTVATGFKKARLQRDIAKPAAKSKPPELGMVAAELAGHSSLPNA